MAPATQEVAPGRITPRAVRLFYLILILLICNLFAFIIGVLTLTLPFRLAALLQRTDGLKSKWRTRPLRSRGVIQR